ncbi:MAG TPA: sodium:alanine symporter family protein [Fermentimonas caenicola]|jgi:AGCS family alanine or glycine:cation symporter|uniref:alanine/glycine:cation symporter family protein n=1 Tax=Lascolabacillus sp. TaxID=1924068 RepID=UPI000ADA98BF|nr:amino acid carrier protein [Lascolabacillus sp.]MBP6174828.1 sodium:alanine symporter family protein [Fermentimonas sp.]TAH61065.1 MAG: sodium:alanine symporter family protein [Fermentimonas caenicola]MBP6197464.1 sodium:alanine symporter family protein [Fermentimonas sp.]MBP7104148.1 sodium:alanine symporter family protein [Fermentimonas sp.]MDD2607259.1 amino acid carrier protein [Lascolabacillus sp.]
MQQLNEIFTTLHQYIGGNNWFIFLLLGTGLFFTLYLKFPQIRYFRHAVRVVRGKYDRITDKGDTTHFQSLATALSGTVGTGNIAGVALAVHLGGPAALFWMLVTAFLGMCTKFVEVTLSHKYREFDEKGMVAGGPMYFMRKRLNIPLKNNKMIKTGYWLGGFFAIATVLSSFGTGSLPQINSISNAIFATFGVQHIITGAVMAVLLALIIIGGIRRIASVTEKLVPFMAIIYFLTAIAIIASNYQNIIPSFLSIFENVFTGTSAIGGFLGAGFAFAFNNGVNRGLFSNEAGQGSAPIAHAAAKAHEPVSEGIVAILEPFIDTVIICFLTGMVILSSGVWSEKVPNQFQKTDIIVLAGSYTESSEDNVAKLSNYLNNKSDIPLYTGTLTVIDGKILDNNSIIHARSLAEDIVVKKGGVLYSGEIVVTNGSVADTPNDLIFSGKSLIHSAPLTTLAYTQSFLGESGKYVVAIGLLLFAFSTAIAWSYYGDRAITYLIGAKYVMIYRIIFVMAFFIASFVDTTIIWNLSMLTVAFMTVPNLIGLLILHKEVKSVIGSYWVDFRKEHPNEKVPKE